MDGGDGLRIGVSVELIEVIHISISHCVRYILLPSVFPLRVSRRDIKVIGSVNFVNSWQNVQEE